MALSIDILHLGGSLLSITGRLLAAFLGLLLLKGLWNISPFHPLAKYPGPLLWRATRLCASYHHAKGDLYQYIAAIHEKYGPTVRIAPDELSFTALEAWSAIYNSRPQLPKSQYHFSSSQTAEDLPPSMITQTDAEHSRLRRLTGSAFLNSSIAEVEPVLQGYSDLLCAQLQQASSEGESQNMVEWFLWALNDVIGQLALDQDLECLEKRRLHPWPYFLLRVLKQTAVINQLLRFGISLSVLQLFMPRDVTQQRLTFFATAKSAIDQRLAREREREGGAAPEEGEAAESSAPKRRPDIVGLMLRDMKGSDKLSDEEILSNAILIVGAGAETTSTCLSATLYHLCQTPTALGALQREIRGAFASPADITLKALADLPYLRAVMEESLRIFPVANIITPRLTPRNGPRVVIDGEVIPRGTYVSMGQWYMGRSGKWFDDAMRFQPERWLQSEEEMMEQKARSGRRIDEILRPFSLGPRNCIGKSLALAEIRLVLAKLVWHFDFELDGEHATWVEDARSYILWELQPLMLHLKPIR